MNTLPPQFAILLLLNTLGLRSISTELPLTEANDEPVIAQTVTGVDGGSDGDGEPAQMPTTHHGPANVKRRQGSSWLPGPLKARWCERYE